MKGIPTWLRVVIIVVVVVAILAWLLPHFISLDRLRAPLAAELSHATGRDANLGAIQAHVFPSIGFRVAGLAIGNPPGFPRGDFLRVSAIAGGLAFWPLLRGQVRVTWLRLERPTLHLLTNAQGASNDQFPSAGGGAPAASTASTSARAAIDSMQLRDLALTSATVSPGGALAPPSFALTGLNLRLRHLQLGGALLRDLDATANLAGVRLVVAALAAPIQIRSGAFALRSGGLQGQCVADLGPAGQATFAFHAADVERPPLQFALHSTDLRLDRLLAPAASAPAAPRSASAPASASASGSPLAQGSLAADRLSWGPYQFTRARATLLVAADRIALAPASLDFAGGHVNAAFDQGRNLSLTLDARGIGLAGLFPTVTALAQRLTGQGALQLHATAPAGAVPQGLVGGGKFQFTNIEIKNSPAVRQLAQLATVAKLLDAKVGVAAGGDLPIGLLKGDLEMAHGRVASKLIQAQTALGAVDLTGSVGFDQTLDYTGTLHFGATTPAQPASTAAKPAPSAPSGLLGALAGALSGKKPAAALGSRLLRRALNLRFRVTGTLAQPRISPLLP